MFYKRLLKRWCYMFIGVALLLGVIYLFKGYEPKQALLSALVWSAITSSIYLAAQCYKQWRIKKMNDFCDKH